MRKIYLILSLLSLTNIFSQATFSEEDYQKRQQEAKQKAREEYLAYKKELLEKVPPPYEKKIIDTHYKKEYTMYDESDYKKVAFKKKNTAKMYEDYLNTKSPIKQYCDEYYKTHQKSFVSKEDSINQINLAKKHYEGAIILKSLNDSIPYDYVKLIDIPDNETFLFVADKSVYPMYTIQKFEPYLKEEGGLKILDNMVSEEIIYNGFEKYYYTNLNGGICVFYNPKNQLYYLINTSTIFKKYKIDENYENEWGNIFYYKPKEIAPLNSEELALLKQYKTLIHSGDANCNILRTIQKKYLTRFGYFNPNKVTGIDKQNFNNNLASLKVKIKKLHAIYRLDTDSRLELKLTTDELASLEAIKSWTNYSSIN